jgi:hypothetical protein
MVVVLYLRCLIIKACMMFELYYKRARHPRIRSRKFEIIMKRSYMQRTDNQLLAVQVVHSVIQMSAASTYGIPQPCVFLVEPDERPVVLQLRSTAIASSPGIPSILITSCTIYHCTTWNWSSSNSNLCMSSLEITPRCISNRTLEPRLPGQYFPELFRSITPSVSHPSPMSHNQCQWYFHFSSLFRPLTS